MIILNYCRMRSGLLAPDITYLCYYTARVNETSEDITYVIFQKAEFSITNMIFLSPRAINIQISCL